MSKYTTEIRYICESLAGELESKGYNSIEDILNKSHSKIFSFDYPIFDPEYKAGLEKKILKRYYTREICAETYGRWKLFLESRMLEIMPYYNQLYNSELLKYDIFEDVNYLRSGDRTGQETGENSNVGSTVHTGSDNESSTQNFTGTDTTDETGTFTDDATNWNKYSDTPQGSVQNIDNDSYLTNATKVTEDREQTSNKDTVLNMEHETVTNSEGSNTYTDNRTDSGEHSKNTLEEYSELIKGKYPGKSYMQMLQEFRETFLNIDKMVIDELSDLFMMIY